MIAFSKKALEAENQASKTKVVIVPEIVVTESANALPKIEPDTEETEWLTTEVATRQEELAMLQRALIRCGLIGSQLNNEEQG
ncbi:MAG: hypothetical protein AAGG48_21450 [Planctomycetota bacterium]